MVAKATARIQRYGGSRHCIYLRRDLVEDSSFPFTAGEEVEIEIRGNELVVRKTEQEVKS